MHESTPSRPEILSMWDTLVDEAAMLVGQLSQGRQAYIDHTGRDRAHLAFAEDRAIPLRNHIRALRKAICDEVPEPVR